MNKTVQELLNQIRELERELRIAIQEQEAKISCQIVGSKVRFDQAVKSAHKRIKTDFFTWPYFPNIRSPCRALRTPISEFQP